MSQHVIDTIGQRIFIRLSPLKAGGQQLFDEAVAGVRHDGGAFHAHGLFHGGQNLFNNVPGLLAQTQFLLQRLIALEELGGV